MSRDLIDYAAQDDAVNFRAELYAAIHDRVTAHIEAKKQEIAQGLLNTEEMMPKKKMKKEEEKWHMKKEEEKPKHGMSEEDELDEGIIGNIKALGYRTAASGAHAMMMHNFNKSTARDAHNHYVHSQNRRAEYDAKSDKFAKNYHSLMKKSQDALYGKQGVHEEDELDEGIIGNIKALGYRTAAKGVDAYSNHLFNKKMKTNSFGTKIHSKAHIDDIDAQRTKLHGKYDSLMKKAQNAEDEK